MSPSLERLSECLITMASSYLTYRLKCHLSIYSLLKKKAKWNWGVNQDKAFKIAKGLDTILSHVMDDGVERPIGYASRTLNNTEQHYSLLEKESLAIVYGVKKFHTYLYGRHFEDHQPLSYLLNEARGTPQMASSRIQHWALTLSAYTYTIHYKAGRNLGNADALSRLPQPVTCSDDGVTGDLVLGTTLRLVRLARMNPG